MSLIEQVSEVLAAQAEQSSRTLHGTGRTFEFKGPHFDTDEAAAYLRYRGRHARQSVRRFLKTHGIPTARRGRTVLVKKSDLDRAIGAVAPRHGEHSTAAVRSTGIPHNRESR